MSEEVFTYVAGDEPGVDPRMMAPAPLWSDFTPESQNSQRLIRAKRVNDGTFWDEMRQVFAYDYKTMPLERFKVWASTLNVPLMSRFRSSEYIKAALMDAQYDDRVNVALSEPFVGMTQNDFAQFFSVFDDKQWTMNRIQHYGHLAMNGFTNINRILKSYQRIIEIGAGAGEMVDVVRKLGYTGEYVVYDFPELLQIQKWYHDRLGHTNNKYVSDPDQLEPGDLVIATWSLTEMPLELREKVVGKLLGTPNWLLAYSNKIFGFDNDAYIREKFVTNFAPGSVEFQDIPWMPWDGGTKYVSVKDGIPNSNSKAYPSA